MRRWISTPNVATSITVPTRRAISTSRCEQIVGPQTDQPLERALASFGGIKMIKKAPSRPKVAEKMDP